MERRTERWSVATLRELISMINFPDYQREPNLWSRAEKQRLIDSMMREFDIASIYLYEHDESAIDCVDGRQRIGAIMSFLGVNDADGDNGFQYRTMNEIEDEAGAMSEFGAYDGFTFARIRESQDPQAKRFVELFEKYEISVVMLAKSSEAHEFNLQFTRLNLGTIINSGEKLNAMVGQLRDACFSDRGLGAHEFLGALGIPTRRYAAEQLAAQIVAQIFSRDIDRVYARTRHYDLQRLFKHGTIMDERQKAIVAKTGELLDLLAGAFDDPTVLRNRAIAVSTVLLAWELGIATEPAAQEYARFVKELQDRLRWQVRKRLDVDPEYRYLMDFQRDITQASVEKPAVERRAAVMRAQYGLWQQSEMLRGDEEWREHNPGKRLGRD